MATQHHGRGMRSRPRAVHRHRARFQVRLQRASNRAHSPELARWLSPDPIERVTGEMPETLPEGANLYTYTANNPAKWSDILGLEVPSADSISANPGLAAAAMAAAEQAAGGGAAAINATATAAAAAAVAEMAAGDSSASKNISGRIRRCILTGSNPNDEDPDERKKAADEYRKKAETARDQIDAEFRRRQADWLEGKGAHPGKLGEFRASYGK